MTLVSAFTFKFLQLFWLNHCLGAYQLILIYFLEIAAIFLNTWESSHDPSIQHGENWANTLFTISESSWIILVLSGLPNQMIPCKVLLLTYRLASTPFVKSTLVLLEDALLSIIYTSFFKEWVYFHFLTSICLKLATLISTLCFCLS